MPPRLESVHPVLMCRDIPASLRFYARLGFLVAFQDSPNNPKYAGVRRDGVELHLQWHDSNEWDYPNDRPTYRFLVSDVDDLFLSFREAGLLSDGAVVKDTSWGTREFHLRDPDANGLQFYRDL